MTEGTRGGLGQGGGDRTEEDGDVDTELEEKRML